MKKQILTTVTALMVMGTTLLAYDNARDSKKEFQHNKGHYYKMHQMKSHGKHSKHKMKVMKLVKQLNLTKEQKMEVHSIMKTSKNKKESMFSAFSSNGFNKEKFIAYAMNKKENMVKLRADTIEKVYNVLTNKQKNQLRVLMDLQEERGI